jgi:hypothetical protein
MRSYLLVLDQEAGHLQAAVLSCKGICGMQSSDNTHESLASH